jgi:hypothetical protein
MAIKMYNRSNGLIDSTPSKKKHTRLLLLPSFRRFRQKQRPEPVQEVREERSPSINEFARSCTSKRDECVADSFDNVDVVSVFDQIDAFVGSFMNSKSCISEVKTDKVKSSGNASIARSRRSNQSNKRAISQNVNAVPQSHEHDAACNIFQCFNCGEMVEKFTTNIVTQELSQIRLWENVELSYYDDDSDNMSALTDISASLATDLIILPRTKSLYFADNTRARGAGRRVLDIAVREDDQSYISFGTIDSDDDIAVDALVRDDISLSFVGRLEEC